MVDISSSLCINNVGQRFSSFMVLCSRSSREPRIALEGPAKDSDMKEADPKIFSDPSAKAPPCCGQLAVMTSRSSLEKKGLKNDFRLEKSIFF